MTLAEAVGAGVGAVGTMVDCVVGLARWLNTPLDPILRLVGAAPLGASPPEARAPHPGRSRGGPQAEVEQAKYFLGQSPEPVRPLAADSVLPDREPGELPYAYGHDRLVLLPRDPGWVFAYWEVTPAVRGNALRALGVEAEGARDVLRVYDVTFLTFTGDNAWFSFDIELLPGADRWYVSVPRPAAAYVAEIGLRTRTGRFVPLVRSSTVSTPRAAPSADTAVHWVELRRDGSTAAAPDRALPRDVPPAAPAIWDGPRSSEAWAFPPPAR
jgi:hypothetical protein